ncbi:MAG: GNAT family N-acetyltransferase [Chloroflexi bacterium]|nr:GNAT family N-acetyltransferase [Chloroflexota bacterium]
MPNGYYHQDVDNYIVEHWHGGYILRVPPWRIGIDHPLFGTDHFESHLDRFPDGQFIGDRRAANFGVCATLRMSRPPDCEVLPWLEAIGDKSLAGHEPDGTWLYIALIWVHPNYRGHGMGSAFLRTCIALAVKLGLHGVYAVPLLVGYRHVADEMDIESYASEVVWGNQSDPFVTRFMKCGFRPSFSGDAYVSDYMDAPSAGNAGVLLRWENPYFKDH